MPKIHSRYITSHKSIYNTLIDNSTLSCIEIAHIVKLTERHVLKILRELQEDGYIKMEPRGRKTVKTIIKALL